ncbi:MULTISPECIES: nuclear transport factor 2 family protein [unclassified Rhodococcus (in: high G+C Gram-positive bacteria)]|uniref:nuclear transport factor 2 family protein n=1 Tax=unclassified Rhodococcus (in: high G+C Gram-positive bacteria) TaxID=192944 RepID=UPI001FFB9343|nr:MULTISPECIES: nuclear transport factor 2 family protein [unclassified Rhodococcus (in: high G+C Gram-positive bacteria)]
MDSRSFSDVASLFAEDGELIVPEPPSSMAPVKRLFGRESIKSELSRLIDFELTFHELVGTVFELGDSPEYAYGKIKCVAHHVMRKGSENTDLMWHLHYSDSYRKIDNKWHLARREICIDMIDVRSIKRVRS